MSNPHQYQQEQSYRIPSFVNTDLAVVAALLPTLATIAVVLRFIARRKKRAGSSRADDWVLWITLVRLGPLFYDQSPVPSQPVANAYTAVMLGSLY